MLRFYIKNKRNSTSLELKPKSINFTSKRSKQQHFGQTKKLNEREVNVQFKS